MPSFYPVQIVIVDGIKTKSLGSEESPRVKEQIPGFDLLNFLKQIIGLG